MTTAQATSPQVLAERIGRGDRSAEQALVLRYSRGLMIMLKKRTGDAQMAEDLHQETFRIVIERLRDRPLEDAAKLTAFIQQVGRNLHTGEIRKLANRKTDADSESIAVMPDPAHGQLSRLIRQEAIVSVRKLIDELKTDRDREILRRFYILDEEKASICASLDLDSAHFDRVISTARQRFSKLVKSRSGPDDPLAEIAKTENSQ